MSDETKRRAAMKKATRLARKGSEKELREAPDPWPQDERQLAAYVEALANREHDYGTCVYAMSLAAVAAFNYIAHRLGVTGFQASCADMDFLTRTRQMKHGFKILDADNLLYPQYDLLRDTQRWISETLPTLAATARSRLKENGASPAVRAHWQGIAALHQPAEDPTP